MKFVTEIKLENFIVVGGQGGAISHRRYMARPKRLFYTEIDVDRSAGHIQTPRALNLEIGPFLIFIFSFINICLYAVCIFFYGMAFVLLNLCINKYPLNLIDFSISYT